MKPLLLTGLLLLGLTLLMALSGMVLARTRKVRRSNASRFTKACTLLVLAAGLGLTHGAWAILHLQTLDFWSFFLILAIVAHSAVWAAIAYQLNKPELQQDFGDSFMVSMLYADQAPQLDRA
jgi:cytochrome bd-type quinol oxidase subunit 2